MREIKFRLWHKEFGMYWFDLSWGSRHASGDGWLYAVPIGEDRKPGGIRPDNRQQFSPDEVKIMQYTGLKDMNGKEIYEGDIVKSYIYSDDTPQLLEVYFEDGGFLINYQDNEFDRHLIGWFPGTLEVIGNVHENPEMLED